MSNALRHHCLLTVSALRTIRCAFHDHDLCHLVTTCITKSTIGLLGSSFWASLALLVDSQHLTCPSHFSAPDVRALVRRVVELIKITDDACCSEHHQLLMISTILSQFCSDSNRDVHLTIFGCNCGPRWLQSVWVIQLVVAATPLTLWLRVLSYDDHPVLNLVAQKHEKDSKLSSSLPHRCVCCAKVLCAMLHSVVNVTLPAAVHPQAAEAQRTVFPGCPSPQFQC